VSQFVLLMGDKAAQWEDVRQSQNAARKHIARMLETYDDQKR